MHPNLLKNHELHHTLCASQARACVHSAKVVSCCTCHIWSSTSPFTLLTALFTLHTAHFTLHTSHFSLHTALFPIHTSHFTLHTLETQLLHLRPSDVVLLPGDTEVGSAVSGPARTLQTLAAVVSGVAMAYHPGAYAVQAAGEAPPCAETAMERVASTRVEQWRSQWGLHDDTDFAYAFASYDSAVAHGGHHVADAWLQARSKTIDEDLIPQAAAVAESSGSTDRPPTWPTPKASMLKRSKMVQALRLRPAPD